MPKSETDNSSRSSTLASAVSRLMRPLVGLLLENGLTYQWLSALLKIVFIEVAEGDFRLPNKRQTDSRIALLTGIHRKNVSRLRQVERTGDDGLQNHLYLGAYLATVWSGDDRFVDSRGRPKPLPRLAGGRGASFEELVTSVSRDIHPRSVLDELVSLGVAELDSKDRVYLEAAAFIPEKGFEEKAYFLGENVHDHLAAVRHNLKGEGPPMIERSVYYDRLTEDSIRELQRMARDEGMKTLRALNKRARKLQAGDRKSKDASHRMKLGVYFYHERKEDAD